MALILIVDDVYTTRLKSELVLRHTGGHNVRSAGNGLEALELARAEMPDAIVLDIVMAGMDGLQTLQALRKHGVTCPVIAFTSRKERVPGEFVRRGFNGYVPKSDNLSALLASLASVIEEKSARLLPPSCAVSQSFSPVPPLS